MASNEMKIHHISTDNMENGVISPRSYANQYSQVNLNITTDEAYIMRSLLSKLEFRVQEIKSSISHSLIQNKESLFDLISKIHKMEQQLSYLLSLFKESFDSTLERAHNYSTIALSAQKFAERFNEIVKEIEVMDLTKKCTDNLNKFHECFQNYVTSKNLGESMCILQLKIMADYYNKYCLYAKQLSAMNEGKIASYNPLLSKVMQIVNLKFTNLLTAQDIYISSGLCTLIQIYSLLQKEEELYSIINKHAFDVKEFIKNIDISIGNLTSKIIQSEKNKEDLQIADESFPLKIVYDYINKVLTEGSQLWSLIKSQQKSMDIDICYHCVWKYLYKEIIAPHINGLFIVLHPLVLVKTRTYSLLIYDLVTKHCFANMVDDEEMKKLLSYNETKGILSLAFSLPMKS